MMATIMMVFDDGEYPYGTYPYETSGDKDLVNQIAQQIKCERGCEVYVAKKVD